MRLIMNNRLTALINIILLIEQILTIIFKIVHVFKYNLKGFLCN